MKKVVAILFAVLLLLGVTACQKASAPDTSPEYKFETDCQYQHCRMDSSYIMAESPETIYYINPETNQIYALDKENDTSILLCGKPDCLHEDNTCNGHIFFYNYCMSYYDGHLYGITTESALGEGDSVSRVLTLTQLSLDGVQRKPIWKIEWDREVFWGNYLHSSTIHRGKFYFLLFNTESGDTSNVLESMVVSYDLKSKKIEYLHRVEGKIRDIMFIGNGMFYFDVYDNNFYRYDLSTGEVTEYLDCSSVIYAGDRLLFNHKNKETQENWLSVTDLEGQNEERYLDLGKGAGFSVQVDGEYLFIEELRYLLLSNEDFEEGINVYNVKTKEFLTKLEYDDSIPIFEGPAMFVSGGKRYLFPLMSENPHEFYYFDTTTIGTPDFQWYEVEKVN